MSTNPLPVTTLGEKEFAKAWVTQRNINTLLYYDRPLLYVAEMTTGPNDLPEQYLVVWIDEDINDELDVFSKVLCVPITPSLFDDLDKERIDMRTAYRNPSRPFALIIDAKNFEEDISIQIIHPTQIPDDHIPDPGVYLHST